MLQDQDEVNLKVDVSVLKEKVSTLSILCDKMDRVIEKLADSQLELLLPIEIYLIRLNLPNVELWMK
jgi:hypothetical protein